MFELLYYNIFEERVAQAQREFDCYMPGLCRSSCQNVLEKGFVGVGDNVADLVFLDLPSPEKCLKEVERVAKPHAHFVVFLPCIEQIH